MASAVALSVISAGATLLLAWNLAQFVALVAIAGHSPNRLTLNLIWVVSAAALKAIVVWLQELVAARASISAKSELRAKFLEAVSKLGRLPDRSSGELTALATTGIDALDAYFSKFLPQLVATALVTPALTFVVWLSDPASAVAVFFTLPLIPIFMVLIGWATQSVQKQQVATLGVLTQHFLEVLRALPMLRGFGRAESQLENVAVSSERYRERTMKVLRISFLSGFALELIGSLSVALIAVSIGLRLVDGQLPLTTGLFVLLLAPEVYLPLRQVGANYHAATEGMAAAEELLAVIDAATGAESESSLPADQLRKLENDMTGLVWISGPSGAGKTTGLESMRASLTTAEVSWMGQNVQLFGGTVEQNIVGPGCNADRVALDWAMDLAALDDLSPEDLVGEHGSAVSGGQTKRIGLARAFYRMRTRDTQWLLLDEPFSAIDEKRARQIAGTLYELAQSGSRVLIVSHQPLKKFDQRIEVERADK